MITTRNTGRADWLLLLRFFLAILLPLTFITLAFVFGTDDNMTAFIVLIFASVTVSIILWPFDFLNAFDEWSYEKVFGKVR